MGFDGVWICDWRFEIREWGMILVHPDWQSWLATGWRSNGEETALEFWGYMEAHEAGLIYSTVDYEGKEVQIYELELITEAHKK